MEMNAALSSFEALSQETRLATVRLLVRAGPAGLPAGDIASALGCRPNTLSTHLKLLVAAGLVDGRREGRSIFYSASYAGLRDVIRYLMEDCCAGHADIFGPSQKEITTHETLSR